MFFNSENQGTINNIIVDDYLLAWMEAFLIDRKASGVTNGTMHFYQINLKLFTNYCDAQAIKYVNQITPTILRQFLLHLEETVHNPGGRHAAYRVIRTFMYWYEKEGEPKDWSNPIRNVKAQRVPTEPTEPVSFDTIAQMIITCKKGTFTDERDLWIICKLSLLCFSNHLGLLSITSSKFHRILLE